MDEVWVWVDESNWMMKLGLGLNKGGGGGSGGRKEERGEVVEIKKA